MILNLYLVLHAESVANILKSYRERISDSKLTENRYFQNTYSAKFLLNGKGLRRELAEEFGSRLQLSTNFLTFWYILSLFLLTKLLI